jgi:hypothetical protein
MTQTNVFDSEKWMTSLFRSLREYILEGIDGYVKSGATPIGLQVYDVVFDFPTAFEVPDKVPFRNEDGNPVTVIHLVVDSIENKPLGFGPGVFSEEIVGAPSYTVTQVEGQGHEISWDVGVWASDASGGSTARLQVYEALTYLLDGPASQKACQSATEGVLIRSFSGGRFLTETLNDIRLYRVVDCELVTHVFSAKQLTPSTASDIVIDPELFIDETIIIDVAP